MPKYLTLLLLLITILACNTIQFGTPPQTITPPPTPTNASVVVARNRNADALINAQAEVGSQTYGLAPLILLPETRLIISKTTDNLAAIWLQYPSQPDDPTTWLAVDSFILAYAAQQHLIPADAVRQTNIGQFDIAAPIEAESDTVQHSAVWINFDDNSGTIVDLSPLAPDFGAFHTHRSRLMLPIESDALFAKRQHGVWFNQLQPLKIVTTSSSEMYYLLARVNLSPNTYDFVLQAHLTQPATHTDPLRFSQGSRIELSMSKADFKSLQNLLTDEGESAFSDNPELWQLRGDTTNDDLTAILEANLPLLWHLVTKMETP